MSDARLHTLFGDAAQIEPATADSYGMPPAGFRLPAATHIRSVTLQVSNLARSLAFYEHILGLRRLEGTPVSAALGAFGSETPLVVLHENARGAASPVRSRLGLYHFAILLPSRADLGQFLRHLQKVGARAGAGDHLVSEALYLHDPDGLGIEVYADRPQAGWQRRGRELVMATDPVDMHGLVAAAGEGVWAGVPAGTTIGHVHLHVGDTDVAGRFYADAVGFDRMVWSYPGALFLAAGGYHHHLGTNTWAGADARAPHADEPQLLQWTLVVPTSHDVTALAASVRGAGLVADTDANGTGVTLRDPWGTALHVVAS